MARNCQETVHKRPVCTEGGIRARLPLPHGHVPPGRCSDRVREGGGWGEAHRCCGLCDTASGRRCRPRQCCRGARCRLSGRIAFRRPRDTRALASWQLRSAWRRPTRRAQPARRARRDGPPFFWAAVQVAAVWREVLRASVRRGFCVGRSRGASLPIGRTLHPAQDQPTKGPSAHQTAMFQTWSMVNRCVLAKTAHRGPGIAWSRGSTGRRRVRRVAARWRGRADWAGAAAVLAASCSSSRRGSRPVSARALAPACTVCACVCSCSARAGGCIGRGCSIERARNVPTRARAGCPAAAGGGLPD